MWDRTWRLATNGQLGRKVSQCAGLSLLPAVAPWLTIVVWPRRRAATTGGRRQNRSGPTQHRRNTAATAPQQRRDTPARALGQATEEGFSPSVPFVATESAALAVAQALKAACFPSTEFPQRFQMAC